MRPLAVSLILALAAAALGACEDDYYRPRHVYVVGPPPPAAVRDHVRWCLDHHPGYDPATNLFPGRDGLPHECRW